MTRARTYTDERLVAALSASKSWRGVLRELGLVTSSSATMRSVRAEADRLGLDYSHFVGQRRWTDAEIRAAIAESESWTAVTARLGVEADAGASLIKGHAARIGADTTHLRVTSRASTTDKLAPTLDHLDRAGPLSRRRGTCCAESMSRGPSSPVDTTYVPAQLRASGACR